MYLDNDALLTITCRNVPSEWTSPQIIATGTGNIGRMGKKLADGNGEVWIRVASRVRRTVLGTYSQKEGLHGKKRIVRLHKITAKDDNI